MPVTGRVWLLCEGDEKQRLWRRVWGWAGESFLHPLFSDVVRDQGEQEPDEAEEEGEDDEL